MEGSDTTQTEGEVVPAVEEQDTTGFDGLAEQEAQEQQPISDADLADPTKVTPQSAPAAARQSGDPLDPATKAAQAGSPVAQGGPDSGNAE